jgi:hypothetical protein
LEPRALEKAKSLVAYISKRGAQIQEFQLALSNDETMELIDWFLGQNPGNELLEQDVQDAHKSGNPWDVIKHFSLMGLDIIPRELLS